MDVVTPTHPITSPWKGRDPVPLGHAVFVDRVNIRTTRRVPEGRLVGLPGFRGDLNADGEVYGESARHRNLYVRDGANGALVSGSLRNWAAQTGLVPFDRPFSPDDAGFVLDALDGLLGWPAGTLRRGRLSMVEGAVDLALPRPVVLYVSACEDLPRTTPFRVGRTTVYFRTDEHQSKLYDKPAQLVASGLPVPDSYGGAHVARFEHTLRSGGVPRVFGDYKDDGAVRAGVLADDLFRGALGRLVVRRARTLQYARALHPDRPPATPADREKWLAVRGIVAAGGLDAALLGVRADVEAGHLTATEGKSHGKALRKLYGDPAYTAVSDLAAEFAAAIDAVAQDG